MGFITTTEGELGTAEEVYDNDRVDSFALAFSYLQPGESVTVPHWMHLMGSLSRLRAGCCVPLLLVLARVMNLFRVITARATTAAAGWRCWKTAITGDQFNVF